MVVLVDDEDRENEGDVIIPAAFASPQVINFMAQYARGLDMPRAHAPSIEQLGLRLWRQ